MDKFQMFAVQLGNRGWCRKKSEVQEDWTKEMIVTLCWTISAIVLYVHLKTPRGTNRIRSHDLWDAIAVLLPTKLWCQSDVSRSISGLFTGIPTHDLCNASAALSPTELWSHSDVGRSICRAHVFPRNEQNYVPLKFFGCTFETIVETV